MPLSIKNERAERLARDLAARRGVGITEAVVDALELALDRERRSGSIDSTLEAVAELQRYLRTIPDRDPRSPDEILGYDDLGLPD